MSMYPNQTRPVELDYGTDDKAVFNFFNTVYAWMAVGLAVTAAVAWYFSQHMAAMQAIYNRGTYLVIVLATVAIVFSIRSVARRVSATIATVMFLIYAAVIGALISGIFIIYPMATIGAAFVVTGGVFAGMSVYGFVTKRDLSSMGSILIMCFWGLFLATIVNLFVANNALSWFITYGILAIFIGLTAYDTQMLRNLAIQTSGDATLAARYAIIGSLELYIDFINMFLSILRIMGNRR